MLWSMWTYTGALGKLKIRNEKTTLGFRIFKLWQILKRFAGTFHKALTLKLGA